MRGQHRATIISLALAIVHKAKVELPDERDAPDAAKFGVGATTLADIERATEARRELSDQQSTTTSGPVRRE
jgi:hypothetical protein